MRSRLVIPAALLVAAAYVSGRNGALAQARPPVTGPVDLPDDVRLRAEAEAADLEALDEDLPLVATDAETAATLAPPPLRPEDAASSAGAREWAVPEFPEFPLPPRRRAPGAGAAPLAADLPEAPPEDPPCEEEHPAPAPPATAAPGPDLAVIAEWTATPATAAPAAAAEPEPVLSEWHAPVGVPARPLPAEPVALSEWEAPLAPPAIVEVEVELDESGRFSLGGWAAQAGHMALCGVTFRDRRAGAVPVGAIRLVPDALANVAAGGLVVLADPGFAPDGEGFTLMASAAGPGTFAATGRYEVVAG